jgi:hypothetical protein
MAKLLGTETMHTIWISIVHLLRNLHFNWEVDAGIAVTVVSCVRYLIWQGRIRLRRSGVGWTLVQGRILSGEVKDLPNLRQWVVTLKYSYFVDEFRSGQHSSMFRSEAEAADYLREAKDEQVMVRFQPNRPDRSTLDMASTQMLEAKLRRVTLT